MHFSPRVLGHCLVVLTTAPLAAQAVLVGYASLPADTFRDGPPSTDQPDGRFRRAPLQWRGQPVQGISSLRPVADAAGEQDGHGYNHSFWALSDNGFGTRANSASYLLCIYRLRFHWKTASGGSGNVELVETVELRDPEGRAGFKIRRADEPQRRLTGADFDPESMDVADDGSFWIGEEFGPYLLHFSPSGILLSPPISAVVVTSRGEIVVRSPDRPGWRGANLARSRGFEGLAWLAWGRVQLLLEGPLRGEAPDLLRLFEYVPGASKVVSTAWRYPLAHPKHAIGELSYWPEREHYVVVERDGGHGPQARFKQVFGWQPTETKRAKWLLADLLDISDPHRLASDSGRFSLPYVTIESVQPMGDRTLLICNDNNFPAMGGRAADRRDETEFVLLQVEFPPDKP